MNRFFVAPEQIGSDRITMEDRDDLRHMGKVLRLQPGDEVEISDGNEWEYRAEILSLDKAYAELKILDKQKCGTESSVRVTLYQGIPKQGKMEIIIQKCVELGIDRIVPVFMDRTVVVDKGNFGRKVERWQKVAAEAVKQCRRGIIPEVAQALRFSQVMTELTGPRSAGSGSPDRKQEDQTAAGTPEASVYDLILIPYENEEGTTIKDALREFAAQQRDRESSGRPLRIAMLIGPEGGFSKKEVDAVTAAGGRSVTLGKTTLRTETAGMAALAMIMYELEL